MYRVSNTSYNRYVPIPHPRTWRDGWQSSERACAGASEMVEGPKEERQRQARRRQGLRLLDCWELPHGDRRR